MTRAFVAVVPPRRCSTRSRPATAGLELPGAAPHDARAVAPHAAVPRRRRRPRRGRGRARCAVVRRGVRGAVRLGGGGAFPKARRAQVLWVGVGRGRRVPRDAGRRGRGVPCATRVRSRRTGRSTRTSRSAARKAATDLRATVAQLDACDVRTGVDVERGRPLREPLVADRRGVRAPRRDQTPDLSASTPAARRTSSRPTTPTI